MVIKSRMPGLSLTLLLGFLFGVSTTHAETESSKARGGKLYDKWYAVTGASAPDTMHPLYPSSGKYAAKPKSNWRCKECHGWDYRGADGAYKTGKHATGIKGIDGAAEQSADQIIALLKAPEHAYGDKLSAADLQDLAVFVSAGQLDMDGYVERATKKPINGDAARGAAYYNTMCANCHGMDGKGNQMLGAPNLTDAIWLYGGDPATIRETLLNGRNGNMPSFQNTLSEDRRRLLAAYVMSLSQ